MRWIGLELLAQVGDVHVDQVLVVVAAAPRLIEQLAAREDATWLVRRNIALTRATSSRGLNGLPR